MPQNGDLNECFGVYKNLCCGQQIMVREGDKFPDCRNHPNLTTIWKPVDLAKSKETQAKKSERRSA